MYGIELAYLVGKKYTRARRDLLKRVNGIASVANIPEMQAKTCLLYTSKNCVSAGRTPVVLSRYKDHSEKLYERLKSYADYVFLMTGNNSKKEHRKILEQMRQINNDESMILVATGPLVGEGFDFPRLDTLFVATPVSFLSLIHIFCILCGAAVCRAYGAAKDAGEDL